MTVKKSEDESLPPGMHCDRDGLYLQVTKDRKDGRKGARTWIYRFMISGGRHDMGLGSLRDVDLEEARRRASDARQLVRAGVSPITMAQDVRRGKAAETKAAMMAGKTFREVAAEYIKAHSAAWKSEVHRRQWDQTLKDYAFPAIGDKPVGAVDIDDMKAILEPIWTDKIDTASRLRGRIEKVIDHALASGYCDGKNPAQVVRTLLLKPALARKAKGGIVNHRAIGVDVMPQFMADLRQRSGSGARGLEFAILTCARTSEVLNATWGEMDPEASTWTIPAPRMKAGKEHVVTLSSTAVSLLRALPQGEAGDYVFPGGNAGRPLSNMAFLTLIKDMGYSGTAHGMRADFGTWAAKSDDYEPWIADACLAYELDPRYNGAYLRTDFPEKRRRLLEKWAFFLSGAAG